MLRVASFALLVAGILTASLDAQRAAGTSHGPAARVPSYPAHVGQRGFSGGPLPNRPRHHGGLYYPYFFPDNEPYWSGEPGPEPGAGEAVPQVVYAPPEREKPPAAAQVIEIPSTPGSKPAKPLPPALFILTNGERLEGQRFVLTASSLSVNIDHRQRVIPLDALDLDATVAANRERGVNLQIPADRNEIFLSF